LKTILRHIKRFYLKSFNDLTKYQKLKTKRNSTTPHLYLDCLKTFVCQLLKSKSPLIKKQKIEAELNGTSLFNELVIFLGVMFYPKDFEASMPHTYLNDSGIGLIHSAELFELIHKVLYSYTNNVLQSLMNKSAAFRLIIILSLTKKRDIFKIRANEADNLDDEDRPFASTEKNEAQMDESFEG